MTDRLVQHILDTTKECVGKLRDDAGRHKGPLPDHVRKAIAGTCSLALNIGDPSASLDLLTSVMKALYQAGYVAGSENPLRNIGRG